MSIQTGRARTLLAGLPKVQLGFFPTPLHRLDRLSEMCIRDSHKGIGGICAQRAQYQSGGDGGVRTAFDGRRYDGCDDEGGEGSFNP